MKIFISWSGNKSNLVAESLRNWFPLVMQSIQPWVSSSDISAGSRWSPEIAKQLEETDFGIICITDQNIDAPWILFESGALAKSLQEGRVCPYLLDIEPSDISGPLAQFQSLKSDKNGTWKLVQGIHDASKSTLSIEQLRTIFDKFWSDLENEIAKVKKSPKAERIVRSERAILEEILSDVRGIKRDIISNYSNNLLDEFEVTQPESIRIIIDAEEVGMQGFKVYVVDENEVFQNFLDILWKEVARYRFGPKTYGTEWALKDIKSGKLIEKKGYVDRRTVSETDIHNEQVLRIISLQLK